MKIQVELWRIQVRTHRHTRTRRGGVWGGWCGGKGDAKGPIGTLLRKGFEWVGEGSEEGRGRRRLWGPFPSLCGTGAVGVACPDCVAWRGVGMAVSLRGVCVGSGVAGVCRRAEQKKRDEQEVRDLDLLLEGNGLKRVEVPGDGSCMVSGSSCMCLHGHTLSHTHTHTRTQTHAMHHAHHRCKVHTCMHSRIIREPPQVKLVGITCTHTHKVAHLYA